MLTRILPILELFRVLRESAGRGTVYHPRQALIPIMENGRFISRQEKVPTPPESKGLWAGEQQWISKSPDVNSLRQLYKEKWGRQAFFDNVGPSRTRSVPN